MCTAALDSVRQYMGQDDKPKDDSKVVPASAVDVPLGQGLAGQARLSILSRRERIRQAVEGEL